MIVMYDRDCRYDRDYSPSKDYYPSYYHSNGVTKDNVVTRVVTTQVVLQCTVLLQHLSNTSLNGITCSDIVPTSGERSAAPCTSNSWRSPARLPRQHNRRNWH